MNDSDLANYSKMMDELRDGYGKPPLSAMMTTMDFESLRPYSLDMITAAIIKHRSNPAKAAFFPAPGDLILYLEGGAIAADQVIAAAKLAQTPFGIMARIHIGTWDLSNMNGFDLRQRAEEVLQLLPMWRKQANAGGYTEHQISIMDKHGVDQLGPFHTGLSEPINKGMLADRIDHVRTTPRHMELLEPPHRDQATASTGSTQVAQIARSIGKLENNHE